MDRKTAAAPPVRRLFAYSLGLLLQGRVRRILKAAGWSVEFGFPREGDAVAVWGRKPTAKRGARIAKNRGVPLWTIEDAFLRSVQTGRQLAPTLGIIVDRTGVYFDTSSPSDLDKLLGDAANLQGPDLTQAQTDLARLKRWGLSKYNAHEDLEGLPDHFVLVIDQTRNDASILQGGASEDSFGRMLRAAVAEHPNTPIVIKTHPETKAGKRAGHFGVQHQSDHVILYDGGANPWEVFARASAVYCVTSQMGMEAIFAGHTPHVFGRPFYAGLGLTHDRQDTAPKASLTPAQLFWACYQAYPIWYDPFRDTVGSLDQVMKILQAQARAWREDHKGTVFVGMRLWKRGFLRTFFKHGPVRFLSAENAPETAARCIVWARDETDALVQSCAQNNIPLARMEDGFVRSQGLGAALVPPVSLVVDDLGIYYDATRPSRLEQQIAAACDLPEDDLNRASEVRQRIVDLQISKYNLKGGGVEVTEKPDQEVILVPGQVEDDASILKGTDKIADNLTLLKRVRSDFPDAYVIYKPHPDVEAGLRVGTVEARDIADQIVADANVIDVIHQVDRVCTMTSLSGFEALIRGKDVTCYGTPFYAGWGLTDDRGARCPRRVARPNLDALVHAALIDYPRYWDPITRGPCSIETILDRFEDGQFSRPMPRLRVLSKLQGVFASYAWLWR